MRKGFTLLELIVVIALIGVLAVVLLTIIDPLGQFQKAANAQRKSDISQIQKALEAYYNDHGSYPEDSNYQIYDPIVSKVYGWGDPWTPYIDKLPIDPSATKRYVYQASSDGQSYSIYASLDRPAQDSQACNSDGSECSNAPSGGVCGKGQSSACTYGVSSPNISP
jgi:general secretion pathway protein G